MKKIVGLIFILNLALSLNAQVKLTSKDSITVFYDSLFKTLRSDYLYTNKVDWATVENETKNNLNQYNDFNTSLSQVTVLFDNIKATHCQLYYNDSVFLATIPQPSETDFSEQWIKKYMSNPDFEVKVIDKKYGYVLVPSKVYEDISAENIHQIAQSMYDQVAELQTTNKLEGWIIDLRFNTGGNIYQMLLSLYDLLGNNEVWGEMDKNKKVINKIQLMNGKYIQNNEVVSAILPKGRLSDKVKVVVITGILTASSGEITAISFKGRGNTLFIGEPTNGMTTTNDKRDLPFGAYMALTTGYDCDRNGKFYEKIIPDMLISKQDNFDDLLLDKNVQEAIKWFNTL